MLANLLSTSVLRIKRTSKKYWRFTSISRLDNDFKFDLSSEINALVTSSYIPSAIELIRLRIFSGFNVVESKRNCMLM